VYILSVSDPDRAFTDWKSKLVVVRYCSGHSFSSIPKIAIEASSSGPNSTMGLYSQTVIGSGSNTTDQIFATTTRCQIATKPMKNGAEKIIRLIPRHPP